MLSESRTQLELGERQGTPWLPVYHRAHRTHLTLTLLLVSVQWEEEENPQNTYADTKLKP